MANTTGTRIVETAKVLYVSDEVGGSGKTPFVSKMEKKYRSRVHVVPIGTAIQMAIHMDEIQKCQDHNIILIDFPKQKQFKREKWSFVEELRDGKVTVNKPDKSDRFKEVAQELQVAFFSNFKPQLDLLSHDGWKHYIIQSNHMEEDPDKKWTIRLQSMAITPMTPITTGVDD